MNYSKQELHSSKTIDRGFTVYVAITGLAASFFWNSKIGFSYCAAAFTFEYLIRIGIILWWDLSRAESEKFENSNVYNTPPNYSHVE